MDCLFCKMIKGEIPCKKIYEDDLVIGILDLYPDSDGHTLIIPKTHYEDLTKIPDELLIHINDVVNDIMPTLMAKMKAKSFSTRVNYGESQAIKHYHMHLLPNYHMKPVTIKQEEAYEILKDVFKSN